MRRQFSLPEGDDAYLRARCLTWETVIEGDVRWLIIHDFPAPAGYNHTKVMAAVRIETGYPDTQLDMVYFHPHLARLDGRPIGALAAQTLDGKDWQRWSRHRTAQNPWRPGEDDLSSHVTLVEHWLEREFLKG